MDHVACDTGGNDIAHLPATALAVRGNAERAGAYFLLGFCFASAIAATGQWRSLVLMAAGGFEAVQLLVGGRHAEIAEAMIKGVGGAVGIGMGYLMTARWSL